MRGYMCEADEGGCKIAQHSETHVSQLKPLLFTSPLPPGLSHLISEYCMEEMNFKLGLVHRGEGADPNSN